MLKALLARLQQRHRTIGFPKKAPTLPVLFRGRPAIESSKCPPDCRVCEEVCPTKAITFDQQRPPDCANDSPRRTLKRPEGRAPASERGVHAASSHDQQQIRLDLGRCLFCPECEQACPQGAIHFTNEYRLATTRRDALVVGEKELELAQALAEETRRLFGRSLKLRQVSAGGCNACEADVNVLNTVVFDLGRFGIQFVASPRHADGLLITGAVPRNMHLALKKTYEAVPPPKLVIAVGACAISGGPYVDNPEVHNGAGSTLPIDLYIPGCPPHPITILDGLLRLLGRINSPASG